MTTAPRRHTGLPGLQLGIQIAVAAAVAWAVFGIWRMARVDDPQVDLRPYVLTLCLILVSLPALIRACILMRNPRLWLIALVTAVLGSMLSMGLFLVGAQVLLMLLPR